MRRVNVDLKEICVNTTSAKKAIYADSKPVKLVPIITRLSRNQKRI